MELKKIYISDIGKVVTGKTPRTSVGENYGGNIPFLTPSDDLSYKSAPKTTKTLTEQGLEEVKNCLLPPHSVCVSCIGSDLGKVVMTLEPTVTNQQFNSIIPYKNFNADFVYYLMTLVGRELNYLSKTSTAVPIINKSSFSNYEVEVPNLETQEKIASILSSIDDKIELNRRINDNLEQQAQALFKSWFVDFEPFKGGKFVESELGMIPEGWRILELKSICSLITKGITPQYDESSNQLVIGQKCIRERKIDLSIARKHIPKQINEKWVQYGDVLINSTGIGTLGRPAQVWFQKKNVTVDSHVTIVRTNRQNDKMFIGQYFLGKQILLESYATGSTGQADLSKERLAMTRLVYPTDNVLNDFNKIITNMVLKIVELQTETEYLSSLRNTLLPKLMSGELKTNKTTR